MAVNFSFPAWNLGFEIFETVNLWNWNKTKMKTFLAFQIP